MLENNVQVNYLKRRNFGGKKICRIQGRKKMVSLNIGGFGQFLNQSAKYGKVFSRQNLFP